MLRRWPRQIWSRPSFVALCYLVASVIVTWPLVTVIDRRIAGDLGDPLFNCWILLWTGGQLLRALHGDLSALSQYWNGNIFYPAPLTLAYSEHLTPQMLQILPLLAATHNVLLCYNVLLLGTFVLSGLGMYLLVRELTNRPLAAFLAGLAFAFAPYRLDQFGHIEVISSQWMPFSLYGFRRFFVTARLRPLAGGASALLAQALSCGYYMAYFTPFAVAYCLYEIVTRRKLGDARTWRALLAAGAATLLIVALFLTPYLKVRRTTDLGVRGAGDIQQFSADTHAFATVASSSRLWASALGAARRPEGQGFPGLTILAFAVVAIGASLKRAITHSRRSDVQATPSRRRWLGLVAVSLLGAILIGLLVRLADVLVTGRLVFSAAGMRWHGPTATVLLVSIAVVAGALLAVSPRLRRVASGVPQSTLGFFACAAVAAAWMSLGPEMHAHGRPIGPGLYDIFYRWVPGFDGLRVPSLNFMLVALFLAVLAGLGAAAIEERGRGTGRLLVIAGMMAIMAEYWDVPAVINERLRAPGYAWPPAEIAGVPSLTPTYRVVRDLPAGAVVAEFPFGDVAYDIRYTFYAGYHRRPIVNGYSGFYPENYRRLLGPLSNIPAGDDAWTALISSGATHAIVHEAFFLDRDGRDVSAWLRRHGAREVTQVQTDRVFALR